LGCVGDGVEGEGAALLGEVAAARGATAAVLPTTLVEGGEEPMSDARGEGEAGGESALSSDFAVGLVRALTHGRGTPKLALN